MLDTLFRSGALPSPMLEAYMVHLLKPGKDPMECSSYRPIALLNMDLKILTKVLATRLAKVIPSLVDIDQTGFMPSKSTDTNLWRECQETYSESASLVQGGWGSSGRIYPGMSCFICR